MRYVVIESTPGYMPDDDDPFTTDDYAAAVAHLNELAAGYADDPDGHYEVTYGLASSANLAAVAVADLDKTHDLGRLIAIEIDEDDAGEEEPARVTLEILYESRGDHDAETNWEHNYYDLRLSYQGRTMDTPWKQGTGILEEPTAAAVLEHLISTAAGLETVESFEEWAGDYGYDPDSRRAEAMYRAVVEEAGKLRELLGESFAIVNEGDAEGAARRLAGDPVEETPGA